MSYHKYICSFQSTNGGDEEIRTPDPLLARQVLSQLSYTPILSLYKLSKLNSREFLLRKEVIQPHLPIRLPCYDFTPVIDSTFDDFSQKVR